MAEAVTRDGCPVELYRRLPYLGEVARFAALLRPGATVLELGCGTGRMTRALLEAGARVTAVDNSPEMLQTVPEAAERVESDIEALDLGRRFDVVLLASFLVNVPDAQARDALLAACRRHVAEGGSLVFQRHDPEWVLAQPAGPLGAVGEVAMHLESVSREGELAQMCLRYEHAGGVWRHRFGVRALGDEALAACLRANGFTRLEWLDARRTWGAARP